MATNAVDVRDARDITARSAEELMSMPSAGETLALFYAWSREFHNLLPDTGVVNKEFV